MAGGLLVWGCALETHAQNQAFDIPGQSVGPAVALFAHQANVQILVPKALTKNRITVSLRGSYTVDEGLAIMLRGSGLQAVQVKPGVYALTREPVPPAHVTPPELEHRSEPVTEIIVTGTRIRRPNAQSASPIVSIDRSELDFEGVLNLEEAINRLTSARGDSGQFQNSSDSDGRAKINLRNLGWQRSLVLLDGQRLLPVQAIDLNIIPSALVRRIDVLTGGASSTYGSDAVAGVTNFILDKHFNGLQLNASYGFYQHTNDDTAVRNAIAPYPNITVPSKNVLDGGRTDINLAIGHNFANGRGNISAFADYRKQDPVLWSARDYSACRINASNAGYSCSVNTLYSDYGSFIPDGVTNPPTYHVAKDGSQTFVTGDAPYAFNTRENYAFMRPDERFTGGVFGNFKFNDHAEIYGTYLYMKDVTSSLFLPPLVYDTANINCNNPYLSSQQATTLCGAAAGTSATARTDVAYLFTGPGTKLLTNKTINADYRLSGGVRGDILDGWHYDVNFVTSQVYTSLSDNNEIDDASFIESLNATTVNGKVVCASGDPACVPANIFSYHAVDPAFYAWAYRNYKWHSVTSQQDATANITGDLTQYGVKSPWADNGVAIALGAEYRREALRNVVNDTAQAYEGWLSLVGGTDNVIETYGEAQVPLVTDKPFVTSLTFNTGYRVSKYSNLDKGLPTAKYELLYRPIKDLLLRTSYNEADRAANISELYSPRSFSPNGSLDDLCAGKSPTYSQAQCAFTGVTAAQYGHITPCDPNCRTYAGGGNPLLRPEHAVTLTYGFVYTPHYVRNLMISADYYDILIKNFIGYLDPVDNFNKCLNLGLPFYCQYIHRDPVTGALNGNGYVEGGTVNTYHLHNRGIDVQAAYLIDLGRWGKVDTNLTGTALAITGGQGQPTDPKSNCAGYFGNPTCYAPEPKWRHNLRATWQTPWRHADISLNWRYIGGTNFTGNSSDPAISNGGCCRSTFITKLKPYNYIDLAGAYPINKRLSVRLSIDNLFDLTPPVLPSTNVDGTSNNPNTYTGTYDPLGRSVLLSFSYKM